MKKKRFPLWAVITILLVLVVGIFYAYNKLYFPSAKAYSSYIETYQEYDASEVNELTINSINHKVVIKPSDDDKIKISYFQKIENMNTYTVENGKLKMELIERVQDLDTLLFKTEKKIDTITIYLPKESNIKINVKSIYGYFSGNDLTVGSVIFQNTTGDVYLKNITSSSASITLNSGNATIEKCNIDDVTVSVVSGQINIDSDYYIDDHNIIAKAIYGSLKINDQQLYTEEEPKTVINQIELTSETATKKISVETLRGNISLHFVEKVQQDQPEENSEGGN